MTAGIGAASATLQIQNTAAASSRGSQGQGQSAVETAQALQQEAIAEHQAEVAESNAPNVDIEV